MQSLQNFKSTKVLLLAFGFSFGFASKESQANFMRIASDSKWTLTQDVDPFLQTPVCRAHTGTSNSVEPIDFFVSYPKDTKAPPMIGLRTKLAAALIAIRIQDGKTEYLYPLASGATSADPNLFWYAPVGFEDLEDIIKARNFLEITIDPKGRPIKVQVSLAGSTNAINAAKDCLKTTPFPDDFFNLLNTKKDAITPDLGDRTPAVAFKAVQDAYDSFQAAKGLNAEIAKLKKTVQPLLDKESDALDSVKSANVAFQTAKTKLDTAKTKVESLQTQISTGKSTLASYQQEKPLAETDLAKKKAIYLPLKSQMAPYEQNLAKAKAAVATIDQEISQNETLISKNKKRIPLLEEESDDLRRNIPAQERAVRSARTVADDADRKYRDYDVHREADRILENDSSFRWAKNDLDNATRQLDQARNNQRNADSRYSDALRAQSACRSTVGANCSAQDSAVQSADSDRQRADQEASNAQNAIQRAQETMQRSRNDADSKARSESDSLRRVRDDANSEVDSKVRRLNNSYDRIAEIRNAIPVLQAQIAKAEGALPALRNRLADANASVVKTTQEKTDFSRKIGFEVAEPEYFAAIKKLEDLVKGIADLTKSIPVWEKDLVVTQKTIDPLTKSFTKTQTDLAAAQAKLAPIQEQLKTFRAEESTKLAALKIEKEKFSVSRAVFQDLLKIL